MGTTHKQKKTEAKIQTSSQWSEGVKQINSTIQSLRARPENMSSPILSIRGGVRKRLRIDAKIVFMPQLWPLFQETSGLTECLEYRTLLATLADKKL